MSQSKIDKEIQLNKIGKILQGDQIGFYIRVEYDADDTKGYYIFKSSSRKFDSPETYDSWVENIEHLNRFFQGSNWKIDWFPDLKVV